MKRFTSSLLVALLTVVTLSISAAPRESREPRERDRTSIVTKILKRVAVIVGLSDTLKPPTP